MSSLLGTYPEKQGGLPTLANVKEAPHPTAVRTLPGRQGQRSQTWAAHESLRGLTPSVTT